MKKILFITKNFPPQKWWIEKYSEDLYSNLSKYRKVYLIANKKGKYFLPFFIIYAFLKWIIYVRKVDYIFIWDWSISFIWYFLWLIFNKKTFITIHWLDITWNNKIYQFIIPKIITKFHKIITVSNSTKEICIKKWVSQDKIIVINNWIDFDNLICNFDINKDKILDKYWIKNLWNKKILFSVSRFIERKWIHDFLENIFFRIDNDFIYIIWWFWKYESIYRNIIKSINIKNVYILWKLNNKEILELETISNLFIMPNIKVNWDVEWFWISVIEAWFYWLPVIWTNIEWLKDAVINEKTWILIDYDKNRYENWIKNIKNFDYNKFNKKAIKEIIIKKYSRSLIIKKYLQIL